MSALNGDKARFQLRRRAGLKRRQHSRLAAATLRLHAAAVAAATVPGAASGPSGPVRAPSLGRTTEAV
jgi:hypothetical protein